MSTALFCRKTALRRFTLALAAMTILAGMAPVAASADEHNPDPWMPLNRGIFRFNDALDRWALEPVAKGYHAVVPDPVETGISNFFRNLWFPVTFANCLLQAKPHEATESMARFIVNSTIGLGGFLDTATRLDIPAPYEDFGQTLGYWGVPPGPFVMLPLFGPSNVRDTFGRAADSATRVWPWFTPWWASSSAGVLETVSLRARFLGEISSLRETSVDYYAGVRNAYLQRRQALVEDRMRDATATPSTSASEDLYYPTDEE